MFFSCYFEDTDILQSSVATGFDQIFSDSTITHFLLSILTVIKVWKIGQYLIKL